MNFELFGNVDKHWVFTVILLSIKSKAKEENGEIRYNVIVQIYAS